MQTITEQCQGRWPDVLCALGIPKYYLDHKNHDCPICKEGKDRFRFTDFLGHGDYICNQCGSGSGLMLVMGALNYAYREALAAIERVISTCSITAAPRSSHEQVTANNRKRLVAIRDAWQPITSGDPVSQYLRNRGLSSGAKVLRYARQPYWQDGEILGEYDCMVAPMQDINGETATYHLTYLQDGEKLKVPAPRKLLPKIRNQSGGAVRLFTPGETLGIAEGIETALAVRQQFGHPCWAALNAHFLSVWQVPQAVERVLIYADHDANYTGHKAAYALANRLATKWKKHVEVLIPPEPGQDWLDVLGAKT